MQVLKLDVAEHACKCLLAGHPSAVPAVMGQVLFLRWWLDACGWEHAATGSPGLLRVVGVWAIF